MTKHIIEKTDDELITDMIGMNFTHGSYPLYLAEFARRGNIATIEAANSAKNTAYSTLGLAVITFLMFLSNAALFLYQTIYL